MQAAVRTTGRWVLALAVLTLLVSCFAQPVAANVLCVPVDDVIHDLEPAVAEVWSPHEAELAFAAKPELLDGWLLPLTGVLVVEKAREERAFIGMIVGPRVCGASFWPASVLRELRWSVFGKEA